MQEKHCGLEDMFALAYIPQNGVVYAVRLVQTNRSFQINLTGKTDKAKVSS